ncbi:MULTISPECIES: hypothetical protein [unclassified Paenarthrobacter]|uniref:hypothetical protein n=1 Tax=unclassified Paenarthrobacter TaxID=2634190 RepID=UPI003CECAD94
MAAQSGWTKYLLGGGLLTAVLALIAGILGMHILVGGAHSTHQAATVGTAASTAVVNHATAAGHAAAGHTGHATSADTGAGTAAPAQCMCQGNCSTGHAMGSSCIPSPKTASLAAPLPERASFLSPAHRAVSSHAGSMWSYQPGSPSPGDLSISRT